MAERYGMLPTALLREASTVDLIIFDTALSYRNYQHSKSKGNIPKESVKQDELERRMKKARTI